MTPFVVYVTTGSMDEAQTIARDLVETRLAASANIVPGAHSIYHWQEQVRQREEAILVIKTQAAQVDEVIARVTALHSYDCPCVMAWPIAAANPDYRDWIYTETSPDSALA